MSAVLIKFPGEYKPHVRQAIPIVVSPPETVPLCAMPRGVNCRDDSYRLTIPQRMALEAFVYAAAVCVIMFACFWVA